MLNKITLIVFAFFASSGIATAASIEETLVWEVIQFEKAHGAASEENVKQVRAILNDMRSSLGSNPKQPETREEALEIFLKLSSVLASRNFVQPSNPDDWTSTVSDALTNPNLSPEKTAEILSYYRNRERSRLVNRTRPVFFMDCDIGALFILSVGQMFGWDMRLVEIPKHNFLRWEYQPGEFVNWDWTYWQSRADNHYESSTLASLKGNMAPIRSGAYLKSQTYDETKGYFFMLPDLKTENPEERKRLIDEISSLGGTVQSTQNNIAWEIVTNPSSDRQDRLSGVSYALSAWSADVTDASVTDTVACAFAALGSKELAIELSEQSIWSATSEKDRKTFTENQALMRSGELCS